MNKQQAAEYLGVSTRAVERYTSKGKLIPSYEKGRTGLAPVYDREQLDKVKEEMESPRPVVQRDKPAKSDRRGGNGSSALMLRPGKGTDLASFVAAIEAARQAARPVVAPENKLTLSLSEASALSGLSQGHLRDAIRAGKLKAKIIGRGWRINRDHLKTYADKLFR
jgi:excisionase family DNA binding protein